MSELGFVAAIFSAMLVNNVILVQFLGICPFLGVSKKMEASLGMSAAVGFVMLIGSIITWLLYNFILVPFEIDYLSTIAFILVIASTVQLVEMFLKKNSKALYTSLGVYLPLITTNCAILGVSTNNTVVYGNGMGTSIAVAIGSALGFALVMISFTAIRETLAGKSIPAAFAGVPISLVIAAMMALAFTGFGGLI
jgi:electron transport complex protein RnfA